MSTSDLTNVGGSPPGRGAGGLAVRGSAKTVWRERRRERIRQLEDAVAEAQASQAELMRRLELFEKIAATAGVEVGERQQAADVPEPLVAAARDPRQDAPVRLEVAGREFIAVVGGEGGDPREWWTAIQHLASQQKSAS